MSQLESITIFKPIVFTVDIIFLTATDGLLQQLDAGFTWACADRQWSWL